MSATVRQLVTSGGMHRFLSPWALVLLLSAPAACSDDSDSGDGAGTEADPSGGGGPAAANCPTRCSEKASDCGAPPDIAAAQCQGICGSNLSEDQLQCLEDESCEALEALIIGGANVCDIGGGSASAGSASAGSASGGSSSGDPTTTPDADIGDACSCSSGGADFESCSGTGSSCGSLTCYVFDGSGICSQTCTADIDGDDCPSGECTEHILNGVTVGTWCA